MCMHTVACVILRKHFSFSSRYTRYSNSLTFFDFEDLQKHYVFGNGELALEFLELLLFLILLSLSNSLSFVS